MRPSPLVALLLSALPLFAGSTDDFRPPTPAELQLKSTPLAPGASAVVLDWAQRQDDSGHWASQYLRIKVLTEEGRKYADVEIPYLKWKYDVADMRARTIQPDGTIVPFNGKIFDKTLIRHGGLRLMAKTFTLPDVHAGTIIEYSYIYRWHGDDLSGVRWSVQRDIPVLHESAWFRPYSGPGVLTIFSLSRGLPAGKHIAKDSCCYSVELENLPPFDKEPLGPPEEALEARVFLLYTEPVANTKEYWDQVGKLYAGIIEDFLGRASALTDEVTKTIGDAATPEAKLRRLYARAQSFRNLSYEIEKTEAEAKRDKTRDNRSSIDVVRNGYGYRTEINRAFVTMARAAGLDAHIVCVADREEDFFTTQLPDASRISEEVAEVVVDGKARYFDPGAPFMPFGMLQWQNANAEGLRIQAKTSGTWIEMPGSEPDQSTIERKADLHFDGDVLKGKIVATYRGLEAQHRRLRVQHDDDTAARKSFEDEAKKWFPEGSSVKITGATPLRGSEEPLAVEYDVELPTVAAVTGSRLLVPLSIFQATSKNQLTSETRKTSVYFQYSYMTHDRVTLHLPAGYRVEGVPARAVQDLTALAFDARYESKTDSVELTRKFLAQTNVLKPEFYPTIRAFFTKVAAADHDSVVLRKTP